MTYGAFVQLDEGLEGLVHVSEMSWTRRVNHPSEVVEVGQEVEVVILEIDHEKREILSASSKPKSIHGSLSARSIPWAPSLSVKFATSPTTKCVC